MPLFGPYLWALALNSKYVIYIVIFTLRILCKPNFNIAVYFNLIKCRIKIKGSMFNCKILEVASYSNLNNYRGSAVRDI